MAWMLIDDSGFQAGRHDFCAPTGWSSVSIDLDRVVAGRRRRINDVELLRFYNRERTAVTFGIDQVELK